MPYLVALPAPEAFWRDSLYQAEVAPSSAAAATADGLADWEARTGLRLPDGLRSLYLQRNGGISDWLDAVVAVEGPLSLHANFGNHWSGLNGDGPLCGATLGEVSDGIDFGDDDASYRHELGEDADRLWVVANYGSSHYLLLDYRGGTEPAVTLFDDQSRSVGLNVLARTFDDFLVSCRREIAHPSCVWAVEGSSAAIINDALVERLSAESQPVARMDLTPVWHRQYGQEHLGLPNPNLAERFTPNFAPIWQSTGGLLGDATLRVYRNRSDQGTRAERFAGPDAALVSVLLPTAEPAPLPPAAIDEIESVLNGGGVPWRRWLDTDGAEFIDDDDLLSP